jgi:uncharacterized lipoprotein NlpE involved in copper resistance
MQYSRAMMRTLMALALLTTLVGCDEKKDAAGTTTTIAPTPSPTTTVAPAPSGAAAAPSGAAAAPSDAAASVEAAKPETAKHDKSAKPGTTTKKLPLPGVMPHGNPEDGTLRYNPPPPQSPPAKKDAAH